MPPKTYQDIQTRSDSVPSRGSELTFTICVPTLNAKNTWPTFAAALKKQSAKPVEVIIVDSSSDDETQELATKEGFRVVQISRSAFRHGATRQFAAEICSRSDILVYLTQDAVLATGDSLKLLLRPFQDERVGAAYGRQLPREGAGPTEAHARIFNYPPVSQVRCLDSVRTFGFKTIFFSNSFGAYRRNALQEVGGFPLDINFGEDTVVAARLILAGWKIAYAAEAEVFHSHAYSLFEEYQRYVQIGKLHATERWLKEQFGDTSNEGFKFMLSQLRTLAREAPSEIPFAVVRGILKYVGYIVGRNIKVTG